MNGVVRTREERSAATFACQGLPPGMSAAQVAKTAEYLAAGRTTYHMFTTRRHPTYICTRGRFLEHCALHPEWAVEVRAQSDTNSRKLKRDRRVGNFREVCLSGRHRLDDPKNIMFSKKPKQGRGLRFCRQCWKERAQRPMTAEEVAAVRHAVLVENRTFSNITKGTPIGGGAPDYSKKIVNPSVLHGQYARDPVLAAELKAHFAGNTGRGQAIRWQRERTARERVRQQDARNDYHKIRDMIPAGNPHRDDIVARIFEDMLTGALKREDVRSRVAVYVTELNRTYTEWAMGGGHGRMRSLDAPAFQDSSMKIGDMVSEGMW